MNSRVKILMVDDHPENLTALEAILDDLGQNLVTARSGVEALRLLLDQEFAVILLDVQMPGMDGFETASLIRQRIRLQHTPIIFLTAIDKNQQSVYRGYSLGAVDYLFKPFEPEVLRAKVSVFIELYRKTEEVRRQAELLRETNRELGKTNKVMGALYRQLEARNAEINQERDFISAVIETAGSCVVVLDNEGAIMRVNRACERMMAAPAIDLVGQRFWDAMAADDQKQHARDNIRRILSGEHPVEIEFSLCTHDSRRLVVAWSNTAVYEKDGTASFVICTGIDITERKEAEDEILKLNAELEERVQLRTGELAQANLELRQEVAERRRAQRELEEAKNEAERANRAKDQFLAVLSHELRTPLTPVLATIEVLQDEPTITGEIRDLFLSIRRNVELEAQLIDDLLDLTRIAKGKLQLHDDQLDAHALLDNVMEICHPNVGVKDLRVVKDLSAENNWVHGDAARLQQVFWNLVKNGIKFTPQGGEITVSTRNDDDGRLIIEVSDTGIGIDDSALAKIFDAFEQASGDITRIFGGLGLGLSICKALVEAHGGEIQAMSRGTGHGATFRVTLPTIPEPAQRPPSDEPRSSAPQNDIHILIVEDHRETNVVIQLFLERQGYRVSSARTVQEARDLVDQTDYDLLISDISLPDGSGLDLMRYLTEQRPIAGIALSGFGMEQDVKRSLEAGFVEHLVKPVGVRALQAAIERVTSTLGVSPTDGEG